MVAGLFVVGIVFAFLTVLCIALWFLDIKPIKKEIKYWKTIFTNEKNTISYTYINFR